MMTIGNNITNNYLSPWDETKVLYKYSQLVLLYLTLTLYHLNILKDKKVTKNVKLNQTNNIVEVPKK